MNFPTIFARLSFSTFFLGPPLCFVPGALPEAFRASSIRSMLLICSWPCKMCPMLQLIPILKVPWPWMTWMTWAKKKVYSSSQKNKQKQPGGSVAGPRKWWKWVFRHSEERFFSLKTSQKKRSIYFVNNNPSMTSAWKRATATFSQFFFNVSAVVSIRFLPVHSHRHWKERMKIIERSIKIMWKCQWRYHPTPPHPTPPQTIGCGCVQWQLKIKERSIKIMWNCQWRS